MFNSHLPKVRNASLIIAQSLCGSLDMNALIPVSIVVNTCNRADDLKRTLDSLMSQSYQNFELIVIDNGSTDHTQDVLKCYPARVVVDATKRLSYLFNLAWKHATHEIIAYIADDAEADRHWLKNIVATLEAHPAAGAVGGPTLSSCQPAGEMHRLYEIAQKSRVFRPVVRLYESLVMEGRAFEPGHLCESGAWTMGAAVSQCLEISEPISVDLLTTTNMGIKRSVLKELGGFDENFLFNHADGDLFVRMARANYSLIFNPEIKVVHHVKLGLSRSPKIIGRDTAYFLLKNVRPHSLRGWLGFIINIAVLNIYWLYKGLEVRDIEQLGGIAGFFIGIFDYLKSRNSR